MSEPQADPKPSPPGNGEVAPSPLMLSSSAGNPILSPEVEPSDNAPTVISKIPSRPSHPENGFAGSLRGRHLGHFELVEALGVGGMAAVIRARDTQLDRNVALKILPPDMAEDPEVVRRFQQEARAAAKLDHENIARVFYCGEDQGLHFIAFECVEGDNLRTILDRRGRLPVPEAIHYMLQVATGLAHASARGVVHRDIKPSNIVITPSGRAKLVDMGLARSLEPQTDHALTQSGVTLGTFDYISPEQALEPRDADVRSDIYSLGCTVYHMLTGQPPVPEGTAAKKLHHHQHVAPVDPRQLNPEIPDEVAAILARMMAKDPKDRYQRAEHLVQHLIQLAQKMGAAAELPDGVLFVDAPLPNPPRVRPLLVGVAAACVLGILVVLHGIAPMTLPPPAPTNIVARETERSVVPKQGTLPPLSPGLDARPEKRPAIPAPTDHEVKDARDLADWLKKRDPVLSLLLTRDLDLSRQDQEERSSSRSPGLVFEGKDRELILQPKTWDPLHPITIKLTYDGNLNLPDDQPWTAFIIKGGKATLRGLRFEMDARAAPKIKMAAVKLQESGKLILENCEFIQVNPPSTAPGNNEQAWLSSVIVEGTRGAVRSTLNLNGCYFAGKQEAGGQDAITVAGAAQVEARNCAFGPHAALVHLREGAGLETDLTLRHCSGFLVDGSAFDLEDNSACRLVVQHCLFSRPETADAVSGGRSALVRQSGRQDDLLQYTGNDNRYHNLSDFWIRAAGEDADPIASTWEDFQRKVGNDKSRVLPVSPWSAPDPLVLLKEHKPAKAFQLKLDQPDLRQVDNTERLVGIEPAPRSAWGSIYDPKQLPPLEKKDAVASKVVDPNVEETIPGKVYKTLNEALVYAGAGDEILIRCNGEFRVDPAAGRLEKPTVNLTIRAYSGYHPVLTLADTSDPEASLFRINDGRLRLDHLEFLLKPAKPEFRAPAVVTVAGVGQCHFDSCVVTLDAEGAEDVPLAVVVLADPKYVVKMGSPALPREMPEVHFQHCFVRGKGDLVAVRASRPLDLQADNCLVALTGSFLSIEGNPQEPAMMPSVQVTMEHLTTYLTGQLILQHTAKEGRDLVPVQVELATDCLFVSASHSSMVRFEGALSDEQKIKSRFDWEVGSNNAYVNFLEMLDQQFQGEQNVPPYGKDKWVAAYTKDGGQWFKKPAFAAKLEDLSLVKAELADFDVKTDPDLQGYGAGFKDLPRPADGGRTALSPPGK